MGQAIFVIWVVLIIVWIIFGKNSRPTRGDNRSQTTIRKTRVPNKYDSKHKTNAEKVKITSSLKKSGLISEDEYDINDL